MKETKLSSKEVYKTFFMTVYEDDVRLENGKETKRIYITHEGAAAVLPITKKGELVLIKQYRYPIQQEIIEVPAGKKDYPEETGEACIHRELEEETGYQSQNLEYIGTTHNCVGYSNEAIELFIAHDCYPVDDPKTGDEDEQIEVFVVSPKEAKTLLQKGKITDAKTWILLQTYLQKIDNS